jgi:hypothetical protein
MGMTIAEKTLATKSGTVRVSPGEMSMPTRTS